ncbi:hypothetical protein BU17DRAFT_67654 [Hysterangium stoloniferum]|nr:hypothetical protein BU17DRAFT_67654 [Hysterangium stoloniferum]
MLDNGGSNGVCKSSQMRLTVGEREMTGGVEEHLSADLGSRERLVEVLASWYPFRSWNIMQNVGLYGRTHVMATTRTAEWAPDDVDKVTSELFGGGIRAYAFGDHIHEREARRHSFELDEA